LCPCAEQRVADVEGADGDRGAAQVQQGLRVVTPSAAAFWTWASTAGAIADLNRGYETPPGLRCRPAAVPQALGI
jgi:hypothetical protein